MKIRNKSSLGLIAALLASTAINADDFVADAPISAVKIHRNYGAIVTRSFSIELPAGQHTVTIPQLTDQLDEDYALRASVVSGNASINQVQLDEVFLPNVGRETQAALLAELEALETAQANDRTAIEAINMQLSFIQGMAKDAAAGGDYSSPADMMEALQQTFEFVKSNSGTLLNERQALEKTISGRADEISAVRREIEQLGGKREKVNEGTLRVSSPTDGVAEITLSYLVRNATWDIDAEANLNSTDNQTELGFYAEITQQTGEEWFNVPMVLSTTQPTTTIGVNTPRPVYWNIEELKTYETEEVTVSGSRIKRQSVKKPTLDSFVNVAGALNELPSFGVPYSSDTFDAEFNLTDPISVTADNSVQKVLVHQASISTSTNIRVVPSLQNSAFAYAVGEFTGVPFLQNVNVTLLRDNTYVGKGIWPTLQPNEELQLPFGSDPKIDVEVVTIPSEDGGEGIFNRKRVDETKKQFRITNNHSTPMTIEVFDALPNSMNEDMEVELLRGNTGATETDYEDQPGVVMWRETVAPGETWVINHWYRVSFPTDKRVVHQ